MEMDARLLRIIRGGRVTIDLGLRRLQLSFWTADIYTSLGKSYCGTRTQISPGFRTSASGSQHLAMNRGPRSFSWLSIQTKGIYLTLSAARRAALIFRRRGCSIVI